MEIDIFDEIQKMRQQGRKAVLATIVQIRGSVPSFQSAKMLIRDDGTILGSVGGGCVEAEVWTAAQDVMRDEKAKIMTFDLTDESMGDGGLICGGKVEIFVEPILPTPKVVIFGAGQEPESTPLKSSHSQNSDALLFFKKKKKQSLLCRLSLSG